MALDPIPMLGGVFGEISGVAPGLVLDPGWKDLSFLRPITRPAAARAASPEGGR